MAKELEKGILTISKLLMLENLAIPNYQRPYKWTAKNVQQLFNDINLFHNKTTSYRLGTLVFHRDGDTEGELNIVDGQQRTLTLMLIVYAIMQEKWESLERQDLSEQLAELEDAVESFMALPQFSSEISQQNLQKNYLEIKRTVARSEFTEQHIDFLLNHCEVVTFTLENISEAFQFFDAQNARGRDLEPHDLLKAYHLREFGEHDEPLKAEVVASWEALESNELAELFALYLYRIRHWALGYSARYFSKNDVGLFKGVNLDNIAYYPYVEPLRIAHHFVDEYNNQYQRKIDHQKRNFPFHLDQIIINGRRFFEMAAHYQSQVKVIVKAENNDSPEFLGVRLTKHAFDILHLLNSYKNRHRTGDKYVRAMFDCALVYYIDKFGTEELSYAIEKLFIWAYRLRIRHQVLQLATMDNHALNSNVFRRFKNATSPQDALSMSFQALTTADNGNNRQNKKAAKKDPLVTLFMAMGYYYE